MKYSFCDGWEFTPHWDEDFGKGLPVENQESVRLPLVGSHPISNWSRTRTATAGYFSSSSFILVCLG